MPVFQLKDGNVGYKDRQVLKDVNWTVRQGDRVALTGANGKPSCLGCDGLD